MVLWEGDSATPAIDAVAVLQTTRDGLTWLAVAVVNEAIDGLLFGHEQLARTASRVNTRCDYCDAELTAWPVGTPAICWRCVERSR